MKCDLKPFVVIQRVRPGKLVRSSRWKLKETGYVEGQNVSVEYYWLEGRFDRIPALMAELVRRRVAVIVPIGTLQVRLPLRQQLRRSRSCSALMTIRSGLASSRVGGLMSYGPDIVD
jgi:hypothetical protein